MFEQWKLPENICDTNPIGKKNLSDFIGRSSQVNRLLTNLRGSTSTVILLEGDIGVGKTSLGNYIRFQSEFFSPTFEVKSNIKWGQKELLHNLICKILQELYTEGLTLDKKTLNNLKMNPLVNNLYIRYTNSFVIGGGFGALGLQANLEKGDVSRPNEIPEEHLFADFSNLANAVKKELNLKHSIIIQLNNLDRSYLFKNKDSAMEFFDNLRDILQVENVSWILSGETGLKEFLKENNPRLYPIIKHTELVLPLSFDSLMESFEHKIKEYNPEGWIPIERYLLKVFYEETTGSLREFLGLTNKILKSFETEPFKKIITRRDIANLFYEEKEDFLKHIYEKHKWSKEILKQIKENPDANQKTLAEKIGVSRQLLKKQIQPLLDSKSNILKEIIDGTSVKYKIDPEISFALEKQ